MTEYSDSFNEHSEALQIRREAENFDNLQHTLSGVETGHQSKHGLSNDIAGNVSGGSKKKSVAQQIRETLDWLLLNDPAYKLAHENLMSAINDAAETTQSVLEKFLSELASVRVDMRDLLSSAAKLDSGKIVFKSANGGIVGEDGKIIPPDLAAQIEWRSDEPTYEEYLALKNRILELENAERELRGIEAKIGGIRDRATDNENRYTREELQPATDTIKGLEERARDIQQNVLDKTENQVKREAPVSLDTSDMNVSELGQLPDLNSMKRI